MQRLDFTGRCSVFRSLVLFLDLAEARAIICTGALDACALRTRALLSLVVLLGRVVLIVGQHVLERAQVQRHLDGSQHFEKWT